MNRNVDVRDISDGHFYLANDMVRADTGGCAGCSECCRSMVDTIILDPWDVYWLCRARNTTYSALVADGLVEMNVADGLILPNLKKSAQTDACGFLDAAGRCTVHDARPGFCRLFPLGRFYEDRDFRYILQVHECTKTGLSKIKVKKWLGIPDLKTYEDYIRRYHFFLRDVEKILNGSGETVRRSVCIYLLKEFFAAPYDLAADFYPQFDVRFKEARKHVGLAG